jgi:hypothetical protein
MFHHQQHQNHLLTKTTKKKKFEKKFVKITAPKIYNIYKRIRTKNSACIATLSFIPILKKNQTMLHPNSLPTSITF